MFIFFRFQLTKSEQNKRSEILQKLSEHSSDTNDTNQAERAGIFMMACLHSSPPKSDYKMQFIINTRQQKSNSEIFIAIIID